MKNLNVKKLQVGQPFIWAFCDFEGKHAYFCQCIGKSDNEIVANVVDLDFQVTLDSLSFCDLYKL